MWGFVAGGTIAWWCGEEFRWWLNVGVLIIGLLVVVELEDGWGVVVDLAIHCGGFVGMRGWYEVIIVGIVGWE